MNAVAPAERYSNFLPGISAICPYSAQKHARQIHEVPIDRAISRRGNGRMRASRTNARAGNGRPTYDYWYSAAI
jgi:hypothetical protein